LSRRRVEMVCRKKAPSDEGGGQVTIRSATPEIKRDNIQTIV